MDLDSHLSWSHHRRKGEQRKRRKSVRIWKFIIPAKWWVQKRKSRLQSSGESPKRWQDYFRHCSPRKLENKHSKSEPPKSREPKSNIPRFKSRPRKTNRKGHNRKACRKTKFKNRHTNNKNRHTNHKGLGELDWRHGQPSWVQWVKQKRRGLWGERKQEIRNGWEVCICFQKLITLLWGKKIKI